MRLANLFGAAAALCLAAATLAVPSAVAQQQTNSQRADVRTASYTVSGRQVSCENVRVLFDRRLPSEGAAARGLLILNPRLLGGLPDAVRLFVFHHECGHHHVGGSEFKADCWAVQRGVNDGWLDGKALKGICASFHGAPPTPTHPSGASRCRNIDQCFATAVAARDRKQAAQAAAKQTPVEPKLVNEPKLISNGTVSFSGGAAAGK
jgi:hypothetical protein